MKAKRVYPNRDHREWEFYIGITKDGDPMLDTISYNAEWAGAVNGAVSVARYTAKFKSVAEPHKCKEKP
jgi:hypothetical protein